MSTLTSLWACVCYLLFVVAPFCVALTLCLCLAVGVGAAVGGGSFRDVTDWRGTVTGTEYLDASEEISVTATAEAGLLSVSAVFEKADEAPYSVIEELGITAYTIMDKNGEEQNKATFTITDKYGNVLKEGEMKWCPLKMAVLNLRYLYQILRRANTC